MSEPVKICVIIEDGLVQAVVSAGVRVDAVVIDYDTEGADASELLDVLQDEGTTKRAFVSKALVEDNDTARAFAMRAHDLAESDDHDGPALFVNHYTCPDCGADWQDQWECTVDDDCPNCGKRHISPYESKEG